MVPCYSPQTAQKYLAKVPSDCSSSRPLLVAKSMLGLLSKPFTYCLPLSLPLLILLRQSLTHYEPNWSWIWDPALGSWILRLKMHATTLCKVHGFKIMSHTSIVMKQPLGKCCIARSVFPRSLWRAPNLHFSRVIFRPFLFCFTPPPTAPKCLSCLFIHPSEGFLHYQPATALGIWHKIKIGVGTETEGEWLEGEGRAREWEDRREAKFGQVVK